MKVPGSLASRDSQTTNHCAVPGAAGERARRRWGARQAHGWDSSAVPQPQSTENTSHHHNPSSYYTGQQVGCRAPAGHAGDGKHRGAQSTDWKQTDHQGHLPGGRPSYSAQATYREARLIPPPHLAALCVLLTSGGLRQITPHSPRVSEQNPSGKRLSAAEPGPAREDTALQGQGILWGHASL